MTIEQLIGRNIKKAREESGFSQEHLGKGLATWLGRVWPRQAVSAAENGGRDFRAVDLLAFSLELGRPASWFLTPMPGEEIEMPAGDPVPGRVIAGLFEAHPLAQLDEIGRTVREARELLESVEALAGTEKRLHGKLARAHDRKESA